MLRALYVGRFQPLHKGHVEAIKYVLKRSDELVIAIGSAEISHSLDNPFTAGERLRMVRASLDELKVEPSRYHLVPIPDAQMHSVWVSQVLSYVPPFSIVYSNEPLTSRLFREFGIKVDKIPFFHRELYSATDVRKRMLTGENWKELLPHSVVKIIEEIGGVERLRELAMTDSSAAKKES